MNKKKTVSQLFSEVLECPELYVGKPNIGLIAAFMSGYEYHTQAKGFGGMDKIYSGFHDWVAKRYEIQTSHGWPDIVSFIGLTEAGAFELTKELWKSYLEDAQFS